MNYKTRNRIIASLFILLLFALLLSSNKGRTYFNLKKQMTELSAEVTELQKQNAELKSEIERLKKDPAYLEEVARHEYGLLKKNEMVFDFGDNKQEKAETPKEE